MKNLSFKSELFYDVFILKWNAEFLKYIDAYSNIGLNDLLNFLRDFLKRRILEISKKKHRSN